MQDMFEPAVAGNVLAVLSFHNVLCNPHSRPPAFHMPSVPEEGQRSHPDPSVSNHRILHDIMEN